MLHTRRAAGTRAINIWPGFVDALAALLMVVIFVLLVFMVAQFYLSNLLSGQEQQAARLRADIRDLEARLVIEAEANDEIAARFNRLQADYSLLEGERARLDTALADSEEVLGEIERELAAAADLLATSRAERAALAGDLDEALGRISADAETIAEQENRLAALDEEVVGLRMLSETLSLQADQLDLAVGAAEAERDQALARVDGLAEALVEAGVEIEGLNAELAAALDEAATVALQLRMAAQTFAHERAQLEETIAERDAALQSQGEEVRRLLDDLAASRQGRAASEATVAEQIDRLAEQEEQIAALRDDIARLEAAISASEAEVDDRDQEIANLQARLNQALLREVEELSRARSDFLGRLRDVMAGHQGVAVVGDRFVFQSEVLFPTGSARLEAVGETRLAEFAGSLLALAEELPADVDWVLRVDGHTDRRPIASAEFPSNWELSTARAVRVVRFLQDQGVPPERLAAAGFGPYQPIDAGGDDDALARNRRIELRLDQR